MTDGEARLPDGVAEGGGTGSLEARSRSMSLTHVRMLSSVGNFIVKLLATSGSAELQASKTLCEPTGDRGVSLVQSQ